MAWKRAAGGVFVVLVLAASCCSAASDDAGGGSGASAKKTSAAKGSSDKAKNCSTINYSQLSKQMKVANVSLMYDGDSSALALTQKLPLVLEIFKPEQKQKAKAAAAERNSDEEASSEAKYELACASFVPIIANATSVKGDVVKSENFTTHTLNIAFEGIKSNGTEGGIVNNLSLNITMVTSNKTQYWEITDLAIKADGKIGSESFTVDNKVVTAQRSGYTERAADKACGRGYSLCAPKGLCWTCNKMDLRPNATAVAAAKTNYAAGIVIPGMKLQPFFPKVLKNGTVIKPKFGYEWDCDPLLSSALWASLLLTLFLAVLFGWGVSYIANARGPDRFDDAKTIPMLAKTE